MEQEKFDIDKYKINTDGFVGMYNPTMCESCGNPITRNDIIGWGEYPANNRQNQAGHYGIAYECPNCFEKQIHHIDFMNIECYMEVKFGE